jgi:hypothetical protein
LDAVQNEEAKPFFYSLVEDDSKNEPNYEVRSYENGRIQHIKMKNGLQNLRIFSEDSIRTG